MVKNKLIAFCILFLFAKTTDAQTKDSLKDNAIFFGIGKTGFIFNVEVDHRFRKSAFGAKIGTGFNSAKYISYFTYGGGVYYLLGKKNHLLELGTDIYHISVEQTSDDQLGGLWVRPQHAVETYHLSFNVGYRGFVKNCIFKAGLAPGFTKEEFIMGAYVSVGIRF